MVVSWTTLLFFFFSSYFLFILLLFSISFSSVRVLGVAVLSHWPVPTLTPSLTPGRGIESQDHWKLVEVTARRGPGWGWCSESRWAPASGTSSLGGCWPLLLPSPPEGESQIQTVKFHMTYAKPTLSDCSVCWCCGLTCPGVLSVGSGPWWNSRCSFPEWRSNTNCLSLPGTLEKNTQKHTLDITQEHFCILILNLSFLLSARPVHTNKLDSTSSLNCTNLLDWINH